MKLQKPWFLFTARLDAGAHVRLHLGYSSFVFHRTTGDTRSVVGLGSERSSDRNTEQWGRLPTADKDTHGAIAMPAQPTEEAYCKVLTRFDKLLVFNSEGDISRDSR